MSETERLAVGALVSVLALVAPGFLLHEAPRFPGSLAGGLLGIAGATLFVLLLAYSLVKRSAWVRARATGYVSMRGVLSFHVYTGVVGALLGILHSGHRYQSPLGVALVSAMLVVVLSGFVGRYYLAQVGADLREQQASLGLLRARYDLLAAGRAAAGAQPLMGSGAGVSGRDLRRLVGAIADLEYAIARREVIKRALSRWTVLHVAAALVLYPLLALHIWNGVYFGLRWLP
ncbi:iron reductase [Siccirubricoccus phaeus]|uniref:iron reductase n=1 Tax=Siccirubricoccus phaeus TaxID=2595053 RepID=UPI0011F1A5C8|nr:iron reductase [Siccirubricoccus phaeus]